MKWLNCHRMKVVLVVFVVGIVFSGGIAKADFYWGKTTELPIKRYLPSASVVDGKIYVIGGLHTIGEGESHPVWEFPTGMDMYDTATDTWTQKADIPTVRGHTSASVVDGKIYVIGGAGLDDGHLIIPAVEVYDPVTDTWTQKADMPTRRWWFSASEVNGKIYIIGGNPTNTSNVLEYDPATDSWTTKADMPTGRAFLSTCVVDGLIYAIGGNVPDNETLEVYAPQHDKWTGTTTVEVYDPATDTWMAKAPMPTVKYGHGAVVVDGKIYVIGGWEHSAYGPIYDTVDIYNPATDTWTSGVDIPVTMAGFATGVIDKKIYFMGGAKETHLGAHWYLTSAMYDNVPIVDYNGDGFVDMDDLLNMIDYWDTGESLGDIAPLPFGDGIVDGEDVEVLMSYWQQEIDDLTLIAHWRLDETEDVNAYDSSGENDGTLHGEPLWQPEGGMVDGAIELDGADDYISTAFVLNPEDEQFSALVWIKGGAPGQVIMSQADGENWLLANASEGKLSTELKRPGRAGTTLVSQTIITDGDWHRIGVVWDGSYRTLYVDDVQVATDEQGSLKDAYDGLYIGAGKTLRTGTHWSGLIDDVRIYDRTITP